MLSESGEPNECVNSEGEVWAQDLEVSKLGVTQRSTHHIKRVPWNEFMERVPSLRPQLQPELQLKI